MDRRYMCIFLLILFVGEAMEQGLRDCCRSIRIGKILIQNEDNNDARLYYAKLPPDVANRKVLLMYPVLSNASVIRRAMDVLSENGVPSENVVLLTLFCSQQGMIVLILLTFYNILIQFSCKRS